MNPLLNQHDAFTYAQYYSIHNISFIPLQYKTKKPAIDAWKDYQTRQPTKQEIIDWFGDGKAHNIGVVCGGVSKNLCVLDFDNLDAFQATLGNEWLKKTLVVKTSRGVHVYVKTKTLEKTKHYKLANAPNGVDVIANGGYAVAPPSIHESGAEYKIISDSLDITELEDFKFLEKLEFKNSKKVTLKHSVGEGERNNTAFNLACRLRRTNYNKEEAHAKLLRWNERRCNPPLEMEELMACVDNAYLQRPEEATPLKYYEGMSFVPKLLAEEILAENVCLTPEKREPYYYDEVTGIYQPAEALIKKLAQQRLGKQTRKRHLEEVINYIRVATNKPQGELEPPINLIPLKNGVLDLDEYELLPHSPKYFFTTSLPVAYNQEATCPSIDAFLTDVIGDENKPTFYELAGYCLRRKYDIQKAIMFVGEGSNGKSTAINVLKAFLGQENTASVPLQTLDGNRFSTSLLEHKLANLSADLPKRALKDTGIFKMLTGGDTLNSERKFMDVTTFENYAKLIFSANKLPSTNDDTNAFFRRWVFLMFNKRFEDKPVEGEATIAKKDPRIIDKLTTQNELSGMLNLALKGLDRLLENGEFTSSKSIEETRKAYIKGSDPIGAFNLECIVEVVGEWVSKDEVYNKFVEYCTLFNLPSTDKQTFCKKLASLRPLEEAQRTINDRRKHGWNGIKVVKEGDATAVATTEIVVQQVLQDN